MYLKLTEYGFEILNHNNEIYINGTSMCTEKNYLVLLLSMMKNNDNAKLELTLLKDYIAHDVIKYFAIRLGIVEDVSWGKYGKIYTLKYLLDKINKKII